MLLVTRGQPTDVVVHNRLKQPTAIHWHGIELESYSDGVAGWSGAGDRLAPLIAPADSFIARLTRPRAGTFIYHTHLGDFEQLTSGLYGALIVMEPGHSFDATHDHVYVAGWDGTDDPPFILVNGERSADSLVVAAGSPQRFRLIAIGVAGGKGFALRRAGALAEWRAVAKDGFDLPASQATLRPSMQRVATGETYDFVVVPTRGEYLLTAGFDDARPAWHQRIIAR
jgi:FtsP/CotA-like multicopper oxidase with cupredoxin domain